MTKRISKKQSKRRFREAFKACPRLSTDFAQYAGRNARNTADNVWRQFKYHSTGWDGMSILFKVYYTPLADSIYNDSNLLTAQIMKKVPFTGSP